MITNGMHFFLIILPTEIITCAVICIVTHFVHALIIMHQTKKLTKNVTRCWDSRLAKSRGAR